MKMKWLSKLSIIAVLMVVFLVTGCGKVVPPGTTVILLKPRGKPVIIEEGVYYAFGRTKVYFVDTKLKSYPVEQEVLCADEINMNVSVKWIGSFAVSKESIEVIKKKVPSVRATVGDIKGYQLSLDKFFDTTMRDVISNVTRTVVATYRTDNIRAQRSDIEAQIKQAVLKRLTALKYPVDTSDVLLTNLDYPKEVSEKRTRIKQAELQDLENAALAKAEVAKAKRDAELASEQGKAQLVKAEADAAANRVRASSLTPEILAVKQLETLVKLAEGQNNTVVVIPYEAIRPGGLQDMLVNREAISDLTKSVTKRKK